MSSTAFVFTLPAHLFLALCRVSRVDEQSGHDLLADSADEVEGQEGVGVAAVGDAPFGEPFQVRIQPHLVLLEGVQIARHVREVEALEDQLTHAEELQLARF